MSVELAANSLAAQSISTELTSLADGLDAAAGALTGRPSGWRGPAAMVLGHLLAARPQRFRAAALACRQAAVVLTRHAEMLRPAATLIHQAEQAPAELAAVLERRAAVLVDESARSAAGSLLALAASAPPRPRSWSGALDRVDQWRAEVVLGAAESTEALASVAVKLMTRMTNPFHQASPIELRRSVAAVADAARHPLELGRAVLDWDTWRSNPGRAIGHLVPDALAAAVSGGSAAGVRATTMAGRTGAALRTAAARDELRREATGAAATAARQALIRRAEKAAQERLAAGGSALSAAWQGEGGARLSALQNAGVEAYHSLSTAAERSLTATMQDVSRLGRGELTGLDHRVKRPESAKRKVAGEHARTGRPLAALLARSEDAVRYSVVMKDADYVRGLTEITAALERHGFHAGDVHNAWHGPRYRGVNSVWLDPRSGTAFEVQFHTPASYRITVSTHELYEEFRLPSISPERKAELHELIAAEYRRAPIPGWVEVLQGKNFPPPSRPDPVPLLPDHSSAAALSGAGVVHLTVTGSQRPAHSRTP